MKHNGTPADYCLRNFDGEFLATEFICQHCGRRIPIYADDADMPRTVRCEDCDDYAFPEMPRKPAHPRPLTKQATRESLRVRAGDIHDSQWPWLLALAPWLVAAGIVMVLWR